MGVAVLHEQFVNREYGYLQDTVPNMPNILQSKVLTKTNSKNASRLPPQSPPNIQSQQASQAQPPAYPQHAQHEQRISSASSQSPAYAHREREQQRIDSASSSHSSGNRSASMSAFDPAMLLDSSPDQHALNSLEGLHAQTGLQGSSATGLPITRPIPSRGNSSLGSSRAGSAFPFDEEADAVTSALTLKGMSLS